MATAHDRTVLRAGHVITAAGAGSAGSMTEVALRRHRADDVPAGAVVRYHGSFTHEHGVYTVLQLCPCDPCWAAVIDFGAYADIHYVLLRDGRPVLEHVARSAFTVIDTGR